MGKMMKFESPSRLASFKSSTLPIEKQSSLAKMRRKFIPSSISDDVCQLDNDSAMMTALPVPTVPPYPIELFENGGELGHTNRAFNITDEFLAANNHKAFQRVPSSEASRTPDWEVANGDRPSPEGAVHSVCSSTTKDDLLPDNKESKIQFLNSSPSSENADLNSKSGSLSESVFYSNGGLKNRSPPSGSSPR
ncbi:uncharacterized protein [Palaemon carinicauda]|uniref:uncharacterized protein n=1 Tax=Palaemon carinicauda TaxID=392227 RepID=UPI0035B600A5